MATLPADGILPTPPSQEAFWALQDEYGDLLAEGDAIRMLHREEWAAFYAREAAWQRRFDQFNREHAGQTFVPGRPGHQSPAPA